MSMCDNRYKFIENEVECFTNNDVDLIMLFEIVSKKVKERLED